MKKKLLVRILFGFPLGVFITTPITRRVSLGLGDGPYSAVVPQRAEQLGSEVGAVLLQYVLSGILGAACAGGSIVWEMENWSLLRQTVVHYLVIACSMFPIAWFTWWMPHTVPGALIYFGIFLVIYAIIFVVMITYWKRKVRQMDACIKDNQNTQ